MNKHIPNIMSVIAICLFGVAAYVITKGSYVFGAALLGVGVFINSVASSIRKQIRYNTPPEEKDEKPKRHK